MIHPNDPKWVGEKFNKLTVLGAVHNGCRWLWECSCDCGGRSVAYPNQVMRGKTKTCGCGRSVTFRNMHTRHGESGTRLHGIWKGMINRCNPQNTHAKYHGKRGITVCDEWRDYVVFRDWAIVNGYAENLTIERRDARGDYCPQNCTWIPLSEQMRNTTKTMSVTYGGKTALVSQWADELGLVRSTVYNRIRRGETPAQALGLE